MTQWQRVSKYSYVYYEPCSTATQRKERTVSDNLIVFAVGLILGVVVGVVFW